MVLDGLWRCLCPSIDAATLARTLQRPKAPSRRLAAIQCRNATTTRAQSTRSDESEPRLWRPQPQNVSAESAAAQALSGSRRPTSSTSSTGFAKDGHSQWVYRTWKKHRGLPVSFFDGQSSPYEALSKVSTAAIVEGLREMIMHERQYYGICNVVRYLVMHRDRKPDIFLYECLIKANADPSYGSAKVVANILEEMGSQGILPTPAIFHSVLDVSNKDSIGLELCD